MDQAVGTTASTTVSRLCSGDSFTAGLNGRDLHQIRRQLVRRKVFHIHLNEAHERAAEVWFLVTTAIDNHADCRDDAAMGVNNIDGFLHAAAARDDVFGHDEFL